MNVSRKRTRKLLLQRLYASLFHPLNDKDFQSSFYDGKFTFQIDTNYIKEITEIIGQKKALFQEVIKIYAPKFDVNKMSPIYILPIYISLAEIFFLKEEIPIKVSINEAIEIVKTYGDESGKKIVNGILNKVMENYDELKREILK